jgi:hypothetical protein
MAYGSCSGRDVNDWAAVHVFFFVPVSGALRGWEMKMTRSSTGGAATSGGVGHEDRCWAWLATYLLTESRLPGWASGHRLVGVGSQTARPVDDVGALTDSGGWLMVQAKKGLKLSESPDSPLAEALAQVVEVVAVGVPDQPPHEQQRRKLRPDLDRVLVLADERAPVTVSRSLATVTERLRTWPAAVPLGEAATNEPERKARDVLFAHLRRLWEERRGEPADDAVLRYLLRPLVVHALNLRDDGEHYLSALVMLRDLLLDQDRAQELWQTLMGVGHGLAEKQSWLDRDGLVAELEAQGFQLKPVTRLRSDVDRLRHVTADNITSLSGTAAMTTPEGPVTLPREVDAVLLSGEGSVAVTGEPGTGKTVLLRGLATSLASQLRDLVLLTAENLRATPGQTRNELNLQHDLKDVLQGWPGPQPGILLLDGLDQTRGEDASQWLPQLAQQLEGSRWRIVASIRRFDLRNGPRWRAMFRGQPVEPEYADPALTGVRHLLVDDLRPAEMERLLVASPALAALIQAAGARLQQLLANPFNLDIAAQLLADGALEDPGRIGNRLDLLNRYWQARVTQPAAIAYERPQALARVVERMLADRRQQVGNTTDTAFTGAGRTLRDLVSDGVLRELPGRIGQPQPPIAFSHPVLFDYAVAVLALGDVSTGESLANRLDEDPNLAMVVRPSLDYRLAIAWRGDPVRQEFWQLALRLTATVSGHQLAAAAAATACSRELRTTEDLAPLGGACLGIIMPAEGQEWSKEGAHQLAFLVAAAISGSGSQQDLLDIFTPFVGSLAQSARDAGDVGLALLATQLLGRAAGEQLPTPNTVASSYWVQVAVDCMTVALNNLTDPRHIQLAHITARPLAHAATLDGASAEVAVRSAITQSALREWSINVALWLIERLPEVAKESPDLAVEIGASVWEYEETRDRSTNITNSQILGLTSTLAQDLNHVRWSVCEKFPDLAATNLEAAARLLIRIVETPLMFPAGNTPVSSERPHVRYGQTLRYAGGHSELNTAVSSFIDQFQAEAAQAAAQKTEGTEGLVGAERQELRRIVDLLITQLSHGEVWQLLLYRAATAEFPALAHLLVPALGTALFKYSGTRGAAGLLAARLSPLLAPDAHRAIENAILNATSVDGDELSNGRAREWRQRDRDTLLSALDRDKIIEPEVRKHLEELAGSDREITPLPATSLDDGGGDASDWSGEDRQAGLTGERSLIDRISGEITEAIQQTENQDEAVRAGSWERLAERWQRLRQELANGTDQSDTEKGQFQLVRGAQQLARSVLARPEEDLGRHVFAALHAALPSAADPPIRDQVDQNWRGWGVTTTTEAVQGVTILARRADWQAAHGDELSTTVKRYLDSPNPVYRMLSAEAISSIFPESRVLGELEQRLSAEPDPQVLARLMHILEGYRQERPLDVDRALQRIATEPQWAILTTDIAADSDLRNDDRTEIAVRLTATLAAAYGTPYAYQTVHSWLSLPLEHAHRAERVPAWLRNFLNPPDLSAPEAQSRAFELLAMPLNSTREAWVEEIVAASVNVDRLKSAIKVAHSVVQELYFGSGVTQDENGVQEELSSPELERFAELALPLLESYSDIHHPKVTHYIIQTIDYVSHYEPKRALLAAVRAASDDRDYAQEALALNAVLKLIQRYLADRRALIVGDPECATAVRKLLETFVRQGWEQAIHFAENLENMFS